MIDYIQSAELNGMNIEKLYAWFVKYPGSARRIIAICDNCNKEREITFQFYCDLCPSCANKKRFEDNPELNKKMSDAAIKRCESPEYRKMLSDLKKEYCKDPKVLKKMSDIAKKAWKEHPESWDDATKDKLGGNDIVYHHWLYDDADLSKYTMPMTRSEHAAMYNRMRGDGYKVPHINSETEDNGLWGYQ
jgi:hypothetical protein